MAKKSWKAEAKRRWGKEIYRIDGEGPVALIAPCRVLTISLWPTQAEAEEQKKFIDETGCGGECSPSLHAIVNLEKLK